MKGMECVVLVLATQCERDAVFRRCGQSGHNARTYLSPYREQQQQQQHTLAPDLAKPAPAQRRAHHCSVYMCVCVCLCGRKAYTRTHRRARTHMHARTHMRAHAHAQAHIHKHPHTHTFVHTHTYIRTHIHTHAHTHTHTHACTHSIDSVWWALPNCQRRWRRSHTRPYITFDNGINRNAFMTFVSDAFTCSA
jgi:hypothetical protein